MKMIDLREEKRYKIKTTKYIRNNLELNIKKTS